MTCRVNDSALGEAMEIILKDGVSGMAKAVEILLNEAMVVERGKYLQAEPYERTEQRRGHSNGFKGKNLLTRIGELGLRIPQVRDSSFYPSALDKGMRSERALKLALAEMYVHGVSTRKVTAIVEELCGCEVSSTEVSRCSKLLDQEIEKWRNRQLGSYPFVYLDARYEKVRQNGQVLDAAVLIALGIDRQGKRSVLGISVKLSEQEVHWRSFLESLQARGLHGVELFISDAHAGLKAARKAVFPSVPWQRCQFHLQQNAQSYIPKKSMKTEVAFDIRAIFNASNLDEAKRQQALVVKKYEKTAPNLVRWIDDNLAEGLTVFNFPSDYWRRLRTSNVLERANREIARRTKIASIFPNEASCERLVSAILMEMSEDWQAGHVYLSVNQSGG